jgi:hypothetical protein
MNRKGFWLGEETLKIIIAIICILGLVYFLVSLYIINKGNKNLEFANESLEHLISEINSGRERVEIYNPKDWDISSFKKPERIPNQCLSKGWESCICICQPAGTHAIKTTLDACNIALGICKESEFVVEGPAWTKAISIKPPLILSIDYENKKIQKEKK